MRRLHYTCLIIWEEIGIRSVATIVEGEISGSEHSLSGTTTLPGHLSTCTRNNMVSGSALCRRLTNCPNDNVCVCWGAGWVG